MAPRLYLSAHDHAFASGPVFHRPADAVQAAELVGNEADGRLLAAVFEQFEQFATLGERLRLSVRARLVSKNGEPRVRIGNDCAIRGVLRCEKGGRIEVGNTVYIGDDVIVSAQERVTIGSLTLLAHGVQIFDNDSHPIDPVEREAHFRAILGVGGGGTWTITSAPVSIGSGCWIGFGAAIMKGVTIGDQAVVAAGSVVVSDVPARSVVAGVPARVIKTLD